jgi:hypothetical protein
MLQEQNYVLLFGSVGLLVAVMVVTGKIRGFNFIVFSAASMKSRELNRAPSDKNVII